MIDAEDTTRTFKTAWFSRAARKARMKRLNKNMHRSIILAKGRRYWIYEYLFAKKDRENIEDDELKDFRTLAKSHATLNEEQIARLLGDKDLTEICHGNET